MSDRNNCGASFYQGHEIISGNTNVSDVCWYETITRPYSGFKRLTDDFNPLKTQLNITTDLKTIVCGDNV